mmetsp:Transcript_4608/g.9212  ORF Transcript_4608/g.9212 Transcript_4608/m.9212 type:complete len:202 (+) Transcript_4608:1428-2033(+)
MHQVLHHLFLPTHVPSLYSSMLTKPTSVFQNNLVDKLTCVSRQSKYYCVCFLVRSSSGLGLVSTCDFLFNDCQALFGLSLFFFLAIQLQPCRSELRWQYTMQLAALLDMMQDLQGRPFHPRLLAHGRHLGLFPFLLPCWNHTSHHISSSYLPKYRPPTPILRTPIPQQPYRSLPNPSRTCPFLHTTPITSTNYSTPFCRKR